MVHAATRSCRKRPCANPVASPATARMGAPQARPLGTLTRNGKYAAISTGARKPIRAVLRKAVRDAPAKAANRIQCDSLTFLHERTSTSAAAMERALKATRAVMPVVNSGRMGVQGMALLHEDDAVRRKSIAAFKRMLDFAGCFGARVGLGIARGKGIPDRSQLANDVFFELAQHAEYAGSVIMLEPADPGVTAFINTMDEAMAWVRRIESPAFSIMLDTFQLAEAEPSIEHGIRA